MEFSKNLPTQFVVFTSVNITPNIKNLLSQKLSITELTRTSQTNLININCTNKFKALYCSTGFQGVVAILLSNLFLQEVLRLCHSLVCLIFVQHRIKLISFFYEIEIKVMMKPYLTISEFLPSPRTPAVNWKY